MDGYSSNAMEERCVEDYKWATKMGPPSSPDASFAAERASMMSYLYDSDELWPHTCMIAFAEHYVDDDDLRRPFRTVQRRKALQAPDMPVFIGVVLSGWQECDEAGIESQLAAFRDRGIDYVRLDCNFGAADTIGGASQLAHDPRFGRLAAAAKACQEQQMVPLVLLQVPWRDGAEASSAYFAQAVGSFASALRGAGVESKRLLLETRPPIGLSAQEERAMPGTARAALGFETGRHMFDAIAEAFGGETIAGFCVAGGSTKGDLPTAMEDDCQNAVRQGMRQRARQRWGYDLCYWEMGAKLMLQPKVGRLWASQTRAGRDAARELFVVNAEDLADV